MRLIASLFLGNLYERVWSLSILGEFLQTCVINPFIRIHVLELFPVSFFLGDSVLSQEVVLPSDDSIRFETYLL